MHPVVKNFYENWVAQDGLARLVPRDQEIASYGKPFLNGEGQETVFNANGVLFLAYFLLLAKAAGLRADVLNKGFKTAETIERLTRKPYRGLFDRWPAGNRTSGPMEHERHDNYAAITSLSALFGLRYTKDILAYGRAHLWYYDNMTPERTRNWLSKEDWAQQRQLGEVAFYYACNGQSPGPIKSLWLLIGLVLNAFKKGDAGQTNLTWLRLYTLLKVAKTGFILKGLTKLVAKLWKWKKGKEYPKGALEPFKQYFTSDHPITQMAAHLGGGWGF